MTLPRKRRSVSTSPRRKSDNGPPEPGGKGPRHLPSYYGQKYAKARIRIRKGCYCYLVWRDGDATREFYLGKKEISTPRPRILQPAAAAPRPPGARAAVRGTK
jgi:hypothetical protein